MSVGLITKDADLLEPLSTEITDECLKANILADIRQSESELASGEFIELEDAICKLGTKYGLHR